MPVKRRSWAETCDGRLKERPANRRIWCRFPRSPRVPSASRSRCWPAAVTLLKPNSRCETPDGQSAVGTPEPPPLKVLPTDAVPEQTTGFTLRRSLIGPLRPKTTTWSESREEISGVKRFQLVRCLRQHRSPNRREIVCSAMSSRCRAHSSGGCSSPVRIIPSRSAPLFVCRAPLAGASASLPAFETGRSSCRRRSTLGRSQDARRGPGGLGSPFNAGCRSIRLSTVRFIWQNARSYR